VAVAVSFAGLVLLAGAGPSRLSIGDLLTLGAAACLGLHIALLDRYAKKHDAAALASTQLTAATVLFLAAWPATGPMSWPSSEIWFALLVCGLLATAAGFWVQTMAQQHLPAVRTAVILTMEPVFATFFGYVLAGDRLSGVQIIGAILMVGAVVVAEVGPALRNNRTQSVSEKTTNEHESNRLQ
jgi:drug/metabolite transporter (DMT)-like permease